MSTPIVSGAIALLLEKNPKYTPDEVKKKIIDSARTLNANQNVQGYGMINIENIL